MGLVAQGFVVCGSRGLFFGFCRVLGLKGFEGLRFFFRVLEL